MSSRPSLIVCQVACDPLGRIGRRLHQIAGIVMIGMGIAMMTGRLSALSYWLLETFPALARIG